MQPVPRIFVSATSRDLRTARGLVSEGLRRMECLPIVQDDFPPDYKSVRDMLRTKIATCDAVVHLAGFYYGAEPQPVIPGPDRRSFTQMEYEIAMELKKPCYVFLCGESFPFDKHDPEPEDKQQLQRDHRARLLQRDELFYEFASPEELSSRTRELQLSVENLREELARERGRRRLTLIVAVAAVVIAIGGGVYLMGRQGEQAKVLASTNLKLEQQGALIEQLLAEQARLRKDGASDPQAIALQAEKNVALANNQSVEDIRATLNQAIVEAQQAVEEARGGKTGLAAALRRVSEKSSKGKSPTGSNSDLAAALDRLAEAQLAAGHVNEAIAAQAERLALLDRDKDPEAWATAASNLALAMRNRDVMSVEPQKILTEALAWAKANPDLGPDHPSTLLLTTGVARTLVTADIDESVAMNRHVFTVKSRTLGPDHPETIEAATVLARVLGISGSNKNDARNTAESEQIFRTLLANAEKKTGPDSQETAAALGELARALRNTGKPEEAEALYRRSVAIHENSLGPDHENTLTALTKIAYLRADQGDYPGAIALARRVLAADEKKAGPDAADTLVSASILAGLLVSSDTPDGLAEAEKIQRHILEARIKTIGAAQPDTLESYEDLAETLEKKGDKKGALKLKLERLAEQGKAVGSDDTGYAGDLFMVASEIFVDHDAEDALPLAEKSLKIRETKLGEADPKTLDSMTLVVRISKSLGDAKMAESLARRQVAIREDKIPDDAAGLAESYSTLVGVLTKFDRSSEALPFARKAAASAAQAWPSGGEDRDDIDAELAELQKSAPRPEPPSPEDFASLRTEWKEKSEKGPWKKVRQELPGHSDSHSLYRQGWTDGDALMRLMEVDSASDTDGTYTFTYWDEEGGLSSVVRIREGVATRADGVKKIADTFNFSGGELVSWLEITDGEEMVVESDEKRFGATGRAISAAAAKAARAFQAAQE